MRVIIPADNAMIVSQRAARVAISWVLDLDAWASFTSCITPERKESFPMFFTSTVTEPSPFIEPPITFTPAVFKTGFDSPVSIDSLTDVSPSIIIPSAGNFSPGFTRILSPVIKSSTAMSSVLPLDSILCASEGISFASSSRALDAPITAYFISIQWPRSITSISVASSRKISFP